MVERDDEAPRVDDDPDAPASEAEIAASQRLRDALEGVTPGAGDEPEVVLALALRAAWDPTPLSEDESQAVLDGTPDAAEQAAAAQLRDALASDRGADHAAPDALHLARALRAAFAPRALAADEHRRIVDAARRALPARTAVPFRRARGPIAFGSAIGAIALAAAIVVFVTSAPRGEAPLAKARTTQPLFAEPFKPGDGSARIDRIASARASDFRDNRFANWGVR